MLEGIILSFSNLKHRIKLNRISEKLQINVEQQKIVIVIKNIIENALKCSEQSDKPVEISVTDKLETIDIKVEDYDTGIPSEKLSCFSNLLQGRLSIF